MKRLVWMMCLVAAVLCPAAGAGAVEKKKAAAKKAPVKKPEAKQAAEAPEEVRKAVETTPAPETARGQAMPKGDPKPATPAGGDPPTAEPEVKPAAVSSMETGELADYDAQPEAVKKVIQTALGLTKRNLTYLFASHDPGKGGMDCSGAVYRVLMDEKVAGVPRQSDEMCGWVQRKGAFVRTEGVTRLEDDRFAKLAPGDLLFWSRKGGVEPGRVIPVTHVMLYLGRRASDGRPVIYGSSDGRSYAGQKRCGVSVFDFSLPKADDPKVEFYGYGSIPGVVRALPPRTSASAPVPVPATRGVRD